MPHIAIPTTFFTLLKRKEGFQKTKEGLRTDFLVLHKTKEGFRKGKEGVHTDY